MTIFKSEKDKKEFVRAFRKMTMSGAVSEDVAVEKLIRNNPHFFHQPTQDDIVKISRSSLNDAIRERARQSNRLFTDLFPGPSDKQKPI
jgi:hypothetical protein